jgi:hypothetical protein
VAVHALSPTSVAPPDRVPIVATKPEYSVFPEITSTESSDATECVELKTTRIASSNDLMTVVTSITNFMVHSQRGYAARDLL